MYRLIWSLIGLYLVYKLIRYLILPRLFIDPQENPNNRQQKSYTRDHKGGKYKFYARNSQEAPKTYTQDLGEEIEYEEIESKHHESK